MLDETGRSAHDAIEYDRNLMGRIASGGDEGMRYPEGHKERSHERILEAAGKVFREQGYVGGGVAAVMAEAGMTKGGFYTHFDSKEDLFSHALAEALEESYQMLTEGLDEVSESRWLRSLIRRYLSREHYERVAEGCPLPTLLSEVDRAGEAPREAFENYLRQMIKRMEVHCPGESPADRDEAAVAMFATMVGGMTFARAVRSERMAKRILTACRKFLQRQFPEREDSAAPAES